MNDDDLYRRLLNLCGRKNVSKDPKLLGTFSEDLSFVPKKNPKFIVWLFNTNIVEKLLKEANSSGFSVIPISSPSVVRYHGDTIPKKDNTIIMNLAKMNQVLSIDLKNRVVMVEPGVTFEQLIPLLRKKGVRLLLPLHPRGSKSVLTSALEREPTTLPRYQWDSSDPLLCTEVVFGTGKLFRTGSAAGPGRLKDMKKSGHAFVNPMGPTQFSPFRFIQGAQGSIGIVTWATLKLELLPSVQKVFHFQSENIQDLLDLQYELVKFRLCDEIVILNNLNLACLMEDKAQEIHDLAQRLQKWNLIFILAGRGKLAEEKISYQEEDIRELTLNLKLDKLKKENIVSDKAILNALSLSTNYPWKSRLKGGFQDVFFITRFEKIPEYISLVESKISQDLGVYIQPINQGTSYHCEFDLYYDLKDDKKVNDAKEKFLDISISLMNEGAFFNRPYGLWAKEAYKRHSEQVQIALKKIKKIFDPNNVLNPGVLCFE